MLSCEVSEHMDVHRDGPPALARMEAWTPGSNCCRQFVQLHAKRLNMRMWGSLSYSLSLFSFFFIKLDRCLNNMIGPPAASDCWGSALERPEWNICGC